MKKVSAPPLRLLVPGVILLVGILAMVFALLVVRPYLLSLSREYTESDIRYSLNRLQGTLEYLLMRGDIRGVQREIAANSVRRDVKYLLVVDEQRRVVASSSLSGVGQTLEQMKLHGASELFDRVVSIRSVQLADSPAEKTIYGAAPLHFPDAGRLRSDSWGAVLIELDLEHSDGRLVSGIEQLFVWISLGILLFGGLFLFAFDRHISRRLRKIIDGIALLESGRYDSKIKLNGRDELAKIARVLNGLANSLSASRDALLSQYALFDDVMRHIPAMVSIVSTPGRFVYVNPRFVSTYGFDPVSDKNARNPLPADLIEKHRRANREVLESGEPAQFEWSVALGGRVRTLFMVKFPLYEAEEARVCTIAMDITEKQQNEQLLMISRRIFENTTEGIIITDADRKIVELNDSFARIAGYRKHELIGKRPELLKSEVQDAGFYQTFWQRLRSEGRWQGEVVNRRPDGTLYPVRLSVSSIVERDGRISGYFAIYQDISAEKRAEEALRELAYYDTLTGLYNRASFKQKVSDAVLRMQRYREPFGLLFIDLDRFKEINDSNGHELGDKLLEQVARRIESRLRKLDVACRLGGDEFTVLVPHVGNETELAVIAQKLIEAIAQPYTVGEQELCIGCSIGIVVAPRDGEDRDQLMRNADAAMYHAKESGRGRYAFFDTRIEERNRRLVSIKHGLRLAQARGELSLVYQPEVDPLTGEVRIYEALMRWNSAELGPVSPAEFIPVAEESDLIVDLTRWLIERVVEECRTEPLQSSKISINLSPRQFRSESWLGMVRDRIRDRELDPACLCIEVTESALVEDFELAGEQLREIKQLGIEVAIDDFGTGYSSLAYLKRLPIDYLKIDRSFVADIHQDVDDRTIVETVIVMAHALGLRVVAEGAETEQQVEFLREQGCDLVQGYYYARPLPLSVLQQDLANN
ncbi:EAL domain-containing protein [Marinobacterium sp. D7]|uniref:EAL domain-containing protein n=1 Tax=Marinobacterium ramblicola TaxID=2849041 RepID=UPI001C2D5C30|nr:EAL domain-containing protein [Marinobacterium ramblicola]MBV1786891.1 EAL domain-containing protein [Marinobacterium ramblicola]